MTMTKIFYGSDLNEFLVHTGHQELVHRNRQEFLKSDKQTYIRLKVLGRVNIVTCELGLSDRWDRIKRMCVVLPPSRAFEKDIHPLEKKTLATHINNKHLTIKTKCPFLVVNIKISYWSVSFCCFCDFSTALALSLNHTSLAQRSSTVDHLVDLRRLWSWRRKTKDLQLIN